MTELEFAGLGVRFVARLVDWIIIFAAPTLVFVVLGVATQNGLFVVITLLWWAVVENFYYIYFHHKTGQTIGKRLFGIRVVKTDGACLSWGDSFTRWFGYALGRIPLYLGQIWIAIDEKNQGWHDKIANTYVMRVKKE